MFKVHVLMSYIVLSAFFLSKMAILRALTALLVQKLFIWSSWRAKLANLGAWNCTFGASSQKLVLRKSAALTSPLAAFPFLNQVGKLILSCALGWLTRWRQYQRSAITGGSKPHPDQPTANSNLTHFIWYLILINYNDCIDFSKPSPSRTNYQFKFKSLYLNISTSFSGFMTQTRFNLLSYSGLALLCLSMLCMRRSFLKESIIQHKVHIK